MLMSFEWSWTKSIILSFMNNRQEIVALCTFLKVLVIPRKWWLRPNMTEKLFTGTLRIIPNQNFVPFDLTGA